MPHDEKNKSTAIPVDLIRETVMPPYEYQKLQHGFGSINADENAEADKRAEKSLVTTPKG